MRTVFTRWLVLGVVLGVGLVGCQPGGAGRSSAVATLDGPTTWLELVGPPGPGTNGFDIYQTLNKRSRDRLFDLETTPDKDETFLGYIAPRKEWDDVMARWDELRPMLESEQFVVTQEDRNVVLQMMNLTPVSFDLNRIQQALLAHYWRESEAGRHAEAARAMGDARRIEGWLLSSKDWATYRAGWWMAAWRQNVMIAAASRFGTVSIEEATQPLALLNEAQWAEMEYRRYVFVVHTLSRQITRNDQLVVPASETVQPGMERLAAQVEKAAMLTEGYRVATPEQKVARWEAAKVKLMDARERDDLNRILLNWAGVELINMRQFREDVKQVQRMDRAVRPILEFQGRTGRLPRTLAEAGVTGDGIRWTLSRGWGELFLKRPYDNAFLTRMGPTVSQEEHPLSISFSERKR